MASVLFLHGVRGRLRLGQIGQQLGDLGVHVRDPVGQAFGKLLRVAFAPSRSSMKLWSR
jgi:hypothetical protein